MNHSKFLFSKELVKYLDQDAPTEPSPERQAILDAHIRARIQSELETLLEQEEVVRREIELTLEKENLDRESSGEEEGDGSTLGDVKASVALLGDLEEIRRKVERFQNRQEQSDSVAARESEAALASCYKYVHCYCDFSSWVLIVSVRGNMSTPLNCWREVSQFKASVSRMEQVGLDTITYFSNIPIDS
jgi:MICOS complex subunit MIC19